MIDNKKILWIINPNSGAKKTSRLIHEIGLIEPPVAYVVTKNLEELEKTFTNQIEKFKAFVIAGGDGTVNEAIKYLYKRPDKLMAVFPMGSGNGFARELGFKNSVQSLHSDIKNGKFLPIDVLSANSNLCINVAGIGFESYVAHKFQHSSSRGLKKYVAVSLRSVFRYKPFFATISYGKKEIEGTYHTITIANTRQFGNNAIIAPKALPNDNKIELVLVKKFPFYMYPIFIYRMFVGTLKSSKYVQYISTPESIKIQSDFKQYHTDGEPQSFKNYLLVKIMCDRPSVLKTKHNKLKSPND